MIVTTRSLSEFRASKPTRKHRLAIVPGILGTVYAVSPEGHAKYFDYDYDAAMAYAGVPNDGTGDPRWGTPPGPYSYIRSGATEANPRPKEKCGWVLPKD